MKSEPVSPKMMRAGLKLYGRKPSAAPASAMTTSATTGLPVRERDREQEKARDRGKAGEQTVEAVDEVDRVHHADVPEQRERIRRPTMESGS